VRLVLDASVALKWFFSQRPNLAKPETDTAAALALLRAVGEGTASLVQPPHFVAEMAAVLAREAPEQAQACLRDLLDIDMQVIDDPHVMARAVDLASRHKHHLFDTLYHALALETPGAMLVTANGTYLRKASREGQIVSLSALRLPV
jgi:predicted nucleic acid-binding protein